MVQFHDTVVKVSLSVIQANAIHKWRKLYTITRRSWAKYCDLSVVSSSVLLAEAKDRGKHWPVNLLSICYRCQSKAVFSLYKHQQYLHVHNYKKHCGKLLRDKSITSVEVQIMGSIITMLQRWCFVNFSSSDAVPVNFFSRSLVDRCRLVVIIGFFVIKQIKKPQLCSVLLWST